MEPEAKQEEPLSPEIQDAMRTLIAAIRVVKLYPPNNPVYSQNVKKSHDSMSLALKTAPDYHVGVQKAFFTYLQTPIGKDTQLNKTIAQDLFAKGIREVIFTNGVSEQEMLVLFRALALSPEEMAMKSGISSILWENSATHITVTESGLDDIITADAARGRKEKPAPPESEAALKPSTAKKEILFAGRTIVLGDIMSDPAAFGASMVELAKKTCAGNETVEDRLLALYQEAGRKIQEGNEEEADTLYEGLAKSVLSLESPYRDGFIAAKLFGGLEMELLVGQEAAEDQQLPTVLSEVSAGRFPDSWTVQQVATLLKKSAARKTAPAPAFSPDKLKAEPIPQDVIAIVGKLSEYSAEELAALKELAGAGMESDIIDAAVRTLVRLLPLVKAPGHAVPDEDELAVFSGVVSQLEDMLAYLLQKKDYNHIAQITEAFRTPVPPAFKPRIADAIKKTTSKDLISSTIKYMRGYPRTAPEFQSAFAYLSSVEREATEIMLELMAEEQDRSHRIFILELVKEVGKNQVMLLGERLSDDRWYFVRNIVSILGENKTDQATAILRKVADHKNVRIRLEVIKGLMSIGGKRAAALLSKFLGDADYDVQLLAVRSYADFPGIGADDAKPLMTFLEERPLKKKEREITLEAIKSLGKIGGRDARDFMMRYDHIRWWKSRTLQAELRDAARKAADEIRRRLAHGR
ncbi:MAG TPA: HEAT repeat domain-containing protein [Nitrospirota bacterium]